jgi:hypothetical protein
MSHNDTQSSQPQRTYDIPLLLTYDGPTSRQEEPLPGGIALIGYRDTDENERNIDLILSSQRLPFNLERNKQLQRDANFRMTVVVPESQLSDALAILAAATDAGAVEAVEGTKGLISF